MTFDIQTLDRLMGDARALEKQKEAFIDTLSDRFAQSLESGGLPATISSMNQHFWVRVFLEFWYSYGEAKLTEALIVDLDFILMDRFPAKVTLHTRAEAEDAIPVMAAFWTFLGREFQLANAAELAAHIGTLKEMFPGLMFNSDLFSPAKAIAMQAIDANIDLSDPKQIERFIARHNAGRPPIGGFSGDRQPQPAPRPIQRKPIPRKPKKR